jgi:hypothetical protein
MLTKISMACFALVLAVQPAFAADGSSQNCPETSKPVSQYQFMSWLAQHGYRYGLDYNVSSSFADPIRLAWEYKATIRCGDILYNFAKKTLALTAEQMNKVMDEMRGLAE